MLEELKNKYNEIIEKINVLNELLLIENNSKKIDEIKRKIDKLFLEKIEVIMEINYLNREVVATDGVVELVRSAVTDDLESFKIFSCIYKRSIGYIEYRSTETEYYGNIGFKIFDKFTGNNYAARALELLKELLSEQGIEVFYVTAKKHNIASIKTIEKVGGQLVKDKDNIYIYRCLSKKRVKEA